MERLNNIEKLKMNCNESVAKLSIEQELIVLELQSLIELKLNWRIVFNWSEPFQSKDL